jgi:iron complex transport system ATP-binding protein
VAVRQREARVAVKLEARALGYGYPGRPVGRGLDLSLGAGEVVCVLGPNGGGKTTLFRTLLGLLAPQAGEVLLDGRSLAHLPREEVARRMGYVPQGHAVQFAFTVREAVLMGRTAHVGLFAAPGAADREAAEQAIATLGIESLAGRVVTELSGGERQLAMIARALAQGARALVLDEPTASLDFGNQVRVLREIRRLAAEGYAVVFSTHDPGQAFLAASRVLLLAHGGALRQGAPQEVITPQNLREVYGVEVRVAAVDGARVCLPAL